MDWIIERLDRAQHDRAGFDCGKPSLTEFLTKYATQYEKRNVGRTFVLVEAGQVQVRGYYTLANGEVKLADLPPAVAKKLPRHPVPVVRLARLAVDLTLKGQGHGARLLKDALQRSARHAESVAAFAVVVDAIDAEAVKFYERYGFAPMTDGADRLFLPIGTIEAA